MLTKSYYDCLKSTNQISIHQGGARSGKTFGILYSLIKWCIENAERKTEVITIFRKHSKTLRGTIFRDLIEILNNLGLYKDKCLNKTEMIYNCFGHVIEFVGLDEPQKLRGRKRLHAYINEANEADFESFLQIINRTTGKIFLDFNPSMSDDHWIFSILIQKYKCDFYKSTYKDNPFLEKSIIENIENLINIDEQYYKIYALGERAQIKGLIFPNWAVIDDIPEHAEKLGYGLDFGFSNSETALVCIYKYQNSLILDEICYEKQVVNLNSNQYNSLQNIFEINKLTANDIIVADPEDKKGIIDLRGLNYNVIPAKKDVLPGINLLKSFKVLYTKRSTNIEREKNHYKWKENVNNNDFVNEPVKMFDHLIDATRYFIFTTYNRLWTL